jgi:hypothetical protein
MSLSTSNFNEEHITNIDSSMTKDNQTTSTQTIDQAEDRRVFIKITLAIVLGMMAAMGLVRLLLDANGANKEGVLGRVLQAQAAIPQIIAEPNELVMFYGSSMTRAGFSPRKFDRDLKVIGKKITSFNFGFGGLNT